MSKGKYVIAGFKVEMSPIFDLTRKRAEKYLSSFDGDADIVIDCALENIQKVASVKNLDPQTCEYLLTGVYFNHKLLSLGGFTFHASAIVYDGKAYLFTADSGVGKSTHTELWLKYAPDSFLLNDDKPIITQKDGVFYASGSPWSGKNDISENLTVPLGGIAFLERAETPFIETASTLFAVRGIIKQTKLPSDKKLNDYLTSTIDKLLTAVPTYEFGCDISKEAFITSFEGMTGQKI